MAMDIVFPANFRESQGDLLLAEEDVIAHQTNCITKNVSGLAAAIFSKHPSVNGNLANPRFDRYGTTDVIPVTNSSYRCVANIYGQVQPGPPTTGPDTPKMRIAAFEQALNDLIEKMDEEKLVSVAFPKLIGCNLAGGDWVLYRQRIRDMAIDISDITFHIIEKKI